MWYKKGVVNNKIWFYKIVFLSISSAFYGGSCSIRYILYGVIAEKKDLEEAVQHLFKFIHGGSASGFVE